MNCPDCGNEAICVKWDEIPSQVGYCSHCDITFILDEGENIILRESNNNIKNAVNIPEMLVGTVVFICNKEHKFFLEMGSITDKSHEHYRIKFRSLDKKIDGRQLWVPSHWVDPIPKELLRRKA